MPELPEVEALAHHLREYAVGRVIARLDVAAISAIKTFDPPFTALQGLSVTGADRHGKFLDVDVDGLHLVIHLARAGWLRWSDELPKAPPKPGRGPLALRVHLDDGSGFDLTEAGTKKGLAVYVVRDPRDVPGIARLGPDALSLDRDALAGVLADQGGRLKNTLTDQRVIAGIGNAYSDEILHYAKLSPFKTANKLTDDELDRLAEAMNVILTDAVGRSVGQKAATLKAEKRSGMRVHARTGMPCPVCGDTIAEVSFADKSFQYCPTCQTGGKRLSDRRMDRLLK
ncbi:Fpg/Nei family DNA glycosylase [Epidermidibacterium keratini]|uniref:Fpg/Nei family DNA glycosylase n=1 Tax=Epidermidibacterium keratini TaxID=1891644 RepID=A0A7L4YQB1_9ACTN|nr:DNA-formamidopyrimidine glycosylase family protein [Epidermidibacterium keratini]QHC00737.1 Fpg/Nei family DNA glycosylase [Epidermidibacterium keratini]